MYYSDKPIASNADDLLKRSSFSKLLANTIFSLNRDDTFTVGVFGKWGSGKTSVVKMMLQELENTQAAAEKDDQIIVVHFEPWNFTDTNQLLNQFFARLANEFRSKGDASLKLVGDALEKYSDAFSLAELIPNLGIAAKIISFFGKNSAEAMGKFLKKRIDANDVQSQKEYVISLLQKQSKRILVVIDDIDRLSNEQIRHVFQLVTSVARFPNTTYLLVFDKEIVVKALEQVQEGSGEDYLEKIIQMPIQIPDIQRTALRQILFNRLDEILKNYTDVNFSESYWNSIYSPCVDPFIKHIRDVNRLCNAIEFKLSAISGEVDFADIVAITALENGMSAIYEWTKKNKALLTGESNQFEFGTPDKKPHEWCEFYEEQFSILLAGKSSVSVDQNNVDFALNYLSYIFPIFGKKIGKTYQSVDRDQLRRNNRIAHPDKFDRYFHLTVDYIDFRKTDIQTAIQGMSIKEFSEFLMEADREGSGYEFLEEVNAKIHDILPERIDILIQALLFTAGKLDNQSDRNMFSLRTQDKAEFIICDLLERIPIQERLRYILTTIASANCEALTVLAHIINLIELAHGRLAAKGNERTGLHKLITAEDIPTIENAFMDRVKALLETTSLFLFGKWRMVLYLMGCFDAEFTASYLCLELQQDESIVRYLEDSVSKWIGAGISYEVNKTYEKYLTKDRVLQAIESQKANGNLYQLPIEVQYASVAFSIYSIDETMGDHGISQESIKKVLDQWKRLNSDL